MLRLERARLVMTEGEISGTSTTENQIDEMVYAIYGLTQEEIAIVEGKT
jgi:hypothetical protein